MKLNDILQLSKEQISKTKIHFAIGPKNKKEPLYEFFKGKFDEWQACQNHKNFGRDFILTFIYFRANEWIFAGFYEKLSVKKEPDYYRYETKLLPLCKDLIGRLVIEYKKECRQSYVYCEKFINRLDISEIMRTKVSIIPFNGYENVLLDFDTLKTIIIREEVSWKTTLSNVKGIYLITDRTNGKQYVGSASGEETFWQRWSSYANTGHGNNKGLRKVIEENSPDYIKNFQFSILEIRNKNTSIEEIIKRENYWKGILLTREFGYNEI